MKLHTKESGTKFTIDSNAEAFKILSSQLYSNKPLAIVRELSCNALDSNNAAKTTTPFEIDTHRKLLVIRDYGVGLTDEQMKNIYTSYFSSTKNNTNDQIGGLGLGSKSPFSYTDKFTIKTYSGQKKREYTAILKGGYPELQFEYEKEDNSAKGVCIEVPILPQDIMEFKGAIVKILQYFPKESYKTSVLIPSKEYSVTKEIGGTYAILSGYSAEKKIVMGPVAYTLENDKLSKNLQQKHEMLLGIDGVELHLPIGSIEVAASRETLSYDNASLDILDVALTTAAKNMFQNLNENIDTAEDYFSALLAYNSLTYSIRKVLKKGELDWKGRKLDSTLTVQSLMNSASLPFATMTRNTLGRKNLQVHWTATFKDHSGSFRKKPIIIFKDTLVGSFNKIIWHNKGSIFHNTILCRGDMFDLYALCKVFDIDPDKTVSLNDEYGVVNVSSLPALTVARRVSSVTGKTIKRIAKADQSFDYKVLHTKKGLSHFTEKTEAIIYNDISDSNYCYALSDRKQIVIDRVDKKRVLFDYLNDANIAKPVEIYKYTGSSIIVIPKTHINVIKSNNILHIEDYVSNILFKLSTDSLFNKILALNSIIQKESAKEINLFIDWFATLGTKEVSFLQDSGLLCKNDLALITLVKQIHRYTSLGYEFNSMSLPVPLLVDAYIKGFTSAIVNFDKKYPLFIKLLTKGKYHMADIAYYTDYLESKKELFHLQEILKDD